MRMNRRERNLLEIELIWAIDLWKSRRTETERQRREVRVHLIDYMDTREREVAIGDWSDKKKSQLIRT